MASEKDQAEQSALINLDSLEVKRSRSSGGQAPFEESGLIDLSGFTGGGPAETRETAGVPSGGPVAASFVPAAKKSNAGLYIALGVMGALLVGGAVYLGMMLAQQNQQPPPQQPVAQAPAADTPAATPTAATPPTPPPAPAKAADAGVADAAAAGQPDAAPERPAVADNRTARTARPARRPGAAPRPSTPSPSAEDAPPEPETRTVRVTPPPQPTPPPKPKPAATSEVDDMLSALDGKPAGGNGGGATAQAKPSSDPMLPERLDRKQILRVVKQNAGAVRKCKSQAPGQSATVTVKMQIAGSGAVSAADVAGGPLKGTAQGNCVERTVKVFRFPQFSGPPMQINMPFAM